jgi:hypothetical protein
MATTSPVAQNSVTKTLSKKFRLFTKCLGNLRIVWQRPGRCTRRFLAGKQTTIQPWREDGKSLCEWREYNCRFLEIQQEID